MKKNIFNLIIGFIFGISINYLYTSFLKSSTISSVKKEETKFDNKKLSNKTHEVKNIENIPNFIRNALSDFNISTDKITIEEWNDFLTKIETNVLKKIVFNSAKGNKGNSLLHILSTQTSLDHKLIKNLIDKGFDINKKNNNGETALLLAIKSSTNLWDIKALMSMGADIDSVNNNGANALSYALLNSSTPARREILDFLLNEQGMNYEDNPDLYLKSMLGNESNIENILDILPKLKKENHNNNMQNIFFFGKGNDKMLDFFVEKGLSIDQTLFNAISRSKSVSIEKLKSIMDKYSLDLNQGSRGLQLTPLMAAIEAGDSNKVKFFLENGANPNIQNTNGKTAFDLAEHNPIHPYWVSRSEKAKINSLLNQYKDNDYIEQSKYTERNTLSEHISHQ